MEQKQIIKDSSLVAACGLYCGACKKYLIGKCPGCAENIKATWCKVRTCCIETKIQSCADCKTISHAECKKLNNFIAKIFSLIFKSDRNACLCRIKEVGYENFTQEMTDSKMPTIKKK